jgi:threonine dehydratase
MALALAPLHGRGISPRGGPGQRGRAKLAAIEHYGAIPLLRADHRRARGACAQLEATPARPPCIPTPTRGSLPGRHRRIELLTAHPDLDALVVPLGGGGLAAGTALAMRALAPDCQLYRRTRRCCRCARSFAKGALDHDFIPDTICDGLRGTLGAITFDDPARRGHAC